MLIGFSVSNFKSFLTQQSVSFLASRISRHKNHIEEIANKKVLKSGLIFGANAGGKSNLIEAVAFSRRVILHGLNRTDTNKKYFRVKQDAYKNPGVFEFRLIANETEYSYGFAFSYTSKEFISEWLVKISSNGETVLYERSVDENGVSCVSSDIIDKEDNPNDSISVRLKVYFEDFGNGISDALKKKSILSDIAQRSNSQNGVFKDILDVFQWFNNLIVIFPDSKFSDLEGIMDDDKIKFFFSKVLSSFDTGIEAIDTKFLEFDLDKLLVDIPKDQAEQIKIDIANKTNNNSVALTVNDQIFLLKQNENGEIVYRKMLLDHGNKNDLFEYSDESDGTQRLFDLIPIYLAQKQNRVIMIDEIDRSLHTNLTRKFLEMFFAVAKDNESQLIATTHDSNLLDLDLLRQDEIWFVERKPDHSSYIYSLNKFKERFDKKIEKDYLIGRYGAIPVFENSDCFEDVIDDEQ